MSEYLVHLTGGPRNPGGRSALQNIVEQGVVQPTGTGVGTVRRLEWLGGTQSAACLSEIPLGLLERLSERHGRYGIGFTKAFVRASGGAPVWYLHWGTPMAGNMQKLVQEAMRGRNPEDPLWRITPFIENPGRSARHNFRYEFDWEREWRVVNGLRFGMSDIVFLFAPEPQHRWAKSLAKANGMPGIPTFDPCWNIDRFQRELVETRL